MNQVNLYGRLTADPSNGFGNTKTGTAYISFSLAINENYSKDGEKTEKTYFANCKAWGSRAELIERYCVKGQMMLVTGKLEKEQWTSSNGENRSRDVVLAKVVTFGEKPRGQQGNIETRYEEPPQDNGFTGAIDESFEGDNMISQEELEGMGVTTATKHFEDKF